MSTFAMVVLIIFVGIMVINFVNNVERDKMRAAALWGAMLVMFVYLAKVLM